MYNSGDLDEINHIFEEKVLEVLDKIAPMKVIQRRRKFRNWLSDKFKVRMTERDTLRLVARRTGNREDWQSYSTSRNKCAKAVVKCKEEYYRKLFEKVEEEKDTGSVYRMTRELLDGDKGSTQQQLLKGGEVGEKA